MKILHVFDHTLPLHSGYTFRSRAILQQQRILGYSTCHVSSPKHPDNTNETEQAEDFLFYRTKPWLAKFWQLPVLKEIATVLALKKRILEVVSKEKADVIHAHSPALNGLAALLAAKKCKLPVVYEIRAFWEDAAVDHGSCKEHDLRYTLTKKLETYVVKKANAVTTICEGLRQDLLSRGIAESKITVIPNAVNPKQFQVIEHKDPILLAKYNLENKQVLGFLGSFYAYEGLDLLIKALPIIHKKLPHACLLLVGGGPQQAALEGLTQQLDLADSVIMPGRVPHAEVNQYYSLVDLLVYPRKSMRLTELVTPLKPLEAMAQGMTQLASDVGGHNELIEHGQTGWLFQKDNIQDLANQAIKHLQQLPSQDEIKQNGLAFVNEQRTWQLSVAHYQPIYESLRNER
ncbi:TIGR04063 family PEP-CTERM/XrtA system glycosyltransferase [Rheinheimera sp. MMS21-TC3]|uniref:TIGR04063 family PEP-CTERM/XrtA system glycosyltransferase n=1 Tax=Rheinheimera sp. MMS21-TC3 TaxID=3072790 RepID=UPI0028C3BEDE|nr:TIGR04063 family PEP-CTERM/XrtA system glycosyltransferase [Rheinheimera sp. MMS21-TC3]WNO60691.1 glycosyltransferase, exosortase A system-associated [Rheinheimera sp. MMS21-TC3]